MVPSSASRHLHHHEPPRATGSSTPARAPRRGRPARYAASASGDRHISSRRSTGPLPTTRAPGTSSAAIAGSRRPSAQELDRFHDGVPREWVSRGAGAARRTCPAARIIIVPQRRGTSSACTRKFQFCTVPSLHSGALPILSTRSPSPKYPRVRPQVRGGVRQASASVAAGAYVVCQVPPSPVSCTATRSPLTVTVRSVLPRYPARAAAPVARQGHAATSRTVARCRCAPSEPCGGA